MHGVRSQLGERHQGEGALVQAGVRDAQRALGDDAVAVQEQVQVDLARAPALAPHAAEDVFHLQQPPQRRPRREQRADLRSRIQVPRLGGADRVGLVDARHRAQEKARLPRELLHGTAQGAHAVAQVGTQADESLDHSASCWPAITSPPSGTVPGGDMLVRAPLRRSFRSSGAPGPARRGRSWLPECRPGPAAPRRSRPAWPPAARR